MVMPASQWAPRPCSGVAGFPWNQWQLCYGISGNFRVEQVAALAWNRWQDSPGIGGSFGVEYAVICACGLRSTRTSQRPSKETAGSAIISVVINSTKSLPLNLLLDRWIKSV